MSNVAMTPAIHSAFIRKPSPLLPFVLVSIGGHTALVAAVLLLSWFKLTPDVDLNQKPIKASLVRLGKKKDERLLPRKEALPPPPKEVKAAPKADAPPPVDNKVAVAVPGVKPQEVKPQEGKKVEDSKSKLFGAFDKLGPAKKPEELEGAEDGDVRGDSATQEGDRYSGLIKAQVQRFYDVSQTISDQERLYLKAQVFFRVARNGSVSDVKLVKSSGNDLFDAAVLGAVKKASPLSPPPAEVGDEFQKDGVVLTFSP